MFDVLYLHVLTTLRQRFGHDAFRPGQEPVVRAVMEGRSALAVFPTGAGKSLCYQLPAVLLGGLTLVVSPLVALMKDQVDAMRAKGIAAARLDSTLDDEAVAELWKQIEAGELTVLCVAPERFANTTFRERFKRLAVNLIVIDEAHCISEWGHNFRPDYLKLAQRFRRWKKGVPVLALTATATTKVARDIRRLFRIAAEDHVQLGFHRPNLDLRITPCAAVAKAELLLEKISGVDGSAIVYVTRQETAEEVATRLARNGVAARAYHAGLTAEVRAEAQQSFMSGETRVMVATLAFGMGIDKSDIRSVIHYNLPKSLENYVQEIGRAGRDGKPARCEMLACGDDLTVLDNFIHADQPSAQALTNLLDRVLRLGDRFDVSPYELSIACDIRIAVVATVLAYLENDGLIEATGVFHNTYRLKPVRSVDQILAGRPAGERRWLKKLMERAEEKYGWLAFDVARIAAELEVKSSKVIASLLSLHRAGEAALRISGVRHAYRRTGDLSEVKSIVARLNGVFLARAESDLARIEQVAALSSARRCLSNALCKYFGEPLDQPCGNCDRCRGVPAAKLKRPKPRRATDAELDQVRTLARERHAALATPRQLARFLCGMSSPAATRARLQRHDAFGLLTDLPFPDVLAIAEAM